MPLTAHDGEGEPNTLVSKARTPSKLLSSFAATAWSMRKEADRRAIKASSPLGLQTGWNNVGLFEGCQSH